MLSLGDRSVVPVVRTDTEKTDSGPEVLPTKGPFIKYDLGGGGSAN